MKILVTGSTGFVGSRVVELAEQKGWQCREQRRKNTAQPLENPDSKDIFVSDISSETSWSGAFDGIDCIVHCAARVHQMNESAQDALREYREINTAGTLNLAQQAAQAGVKRFIFLSSVKVNGEFTDIGKPFSEKVENPPLDPYGLSKYEAEVGLKKLAEETGLEVVVIRSPLVYGPGVKANFLSMMNWIRKGIPLPLGRIKNSRSLVFRDNLVDLILTSVTHPGASNQTFMVSDDHDVSVTELLKTIAFAMKVSNRLLPVPETWLVFAARLIGKPEIASRLCQNLQVDISQTKSALNWAPPYSFKQGIEITVRNYLNREDAI